MTSFKIIYFLPILALIMTPKVGFAQTIQVIRNLNGKVAIKDYQTAVNNQLFHQKKNLLYCPEVGGTPNINVDAVVERSQEIEVQDSKIIFTWNETGHLYFDKIKLVITLTSEKKTIKDLNLEYFQYGKVNVENLQEPVLVDGFNLLGECK